MTFRRHVPPPHLRPYVSAAHGYRVAANPVGIHRGLPSRHVTLVVELNGPLRVSGLAKAVASHGVVGGLHTTPALIDASRPQEGLQYALSPLAAGALLGVRAGDMGGRVVDLADVMGTAADQLVDSVASNDDWEERFRLIDSALLRRLDDPPRVEAALHEAWRLVFASSGRLTVAHLADRVGYSRRHLSERFRLVTGVTPKQAGRIARFEAARAMLLRGQGPTLAHVAAACGYADQPHLAREWKALAGCSVTTWLREELPFVQAVDMPDISSSWT
ncbi:MAG: helix-turn-helix domain-containing protein [Nitriliruptorales bacterium]